MAKQTIDTKKSVTTISWGNKSKSSGSKSGSTKSSGSKCNGSCPAHCKKK